MKGWIDLWLTVKPVKRIKQAIWLHKLRKASKRGEAINLNDLKLEAEMNYTQLEGGIRHALTFFGGFAVAKGWLSAEEMTALVGGVLAVGGVVWSIWQKRKAS